MSSNKDTVDYHHRKFKLNLSGRSVNGSYTFDMDPPNEKAFSDRYNQCLVKVSRVSINNSASHSFGYSDIWVDTAGGAIDTDNILLETNIASGNCLTKNDLSPNSISRVGVVLSNSIEGGSFPYPSSTVVSGVNSQGAVQISDGLTATAGKTDRLNVFKGLVWKYQDDRPIEDAGILCGNIFGRPLTCSTRTTHDGAGFVTGDKIVLEATAAGASPIINSLFIELEVLMLANKVI